MLEVITANLDLVAMGCATAIRSFLAAGTGEVIVNVSSHQAQRTVCHALPYATAKGQLTKVCPALWPSSRSRPWSSGCPRAAQLRCVCGW